MHPTLSPQRLGLIVMALAIALPGCAPLADVQSSAGPGTIPTRSYTEPYQVGPLDEIVISKGKATPIRIKVTTDAPVEYPDGNPLHVIGDTPGQVETILEGRDPDITSVTVTEYRGNRITVTGEVNIQTNFDMQDEPMRVLDAIASAGGFTPLANASEVRLVRHNAGKVTVYLLDLSAAERGSSDFLNLPLEPGDRIYVPKNFL
jgi:polysaccharide export outer membrane protein